MNNRAFCENCRKDVEYTVENRTMVGSLKNDDIEYNGKIARCAVCGDEVYIDEINDFNLKALYDAYRKASGIITQEEIMEIPEKYEIGKRPLSLLLGWGEMTFSRYSDGYVPTKQYSDTLKRILMEPDYYLSMLIANKDKLTEVAFERSRRATQSLLKQKSEASSKIEVVITYLLSRCEELTPLALQKLLYYIQGFYSAFTGDFLFQEECEAWIHGPVYRPVYEKYSSCGCNHIGNEGVSTEETGLSSVEKAVIDSVIRNLACYSGNMLERFTHMETPWMQTRQGLSDSVPSNRVIDKEIIRRYFVDVKQKHNMLTPRDIESYARDMFQLSR